MVSADACPRSTSTMRAASGPPAEQPPTAEPDTRRRATLADLQRLKAKPGQRTVARALADPASSTSRGMMSMIRIAKRSRCHAGGRHRRGSGPAPVRQRGSRRATASRSAGGGSDPDEPEPPGGRHPHPAVAPPGYDGRDAVIARSADADGRAKRRDRLIRAQPQRRRRVRACPTCGEFEVATTYTAPKGTFAARLDAPCRCGIGGDDLLDPLHLEGTP